MHKRHNVSVLMYHLMYAAKYRRVVMSNRVEEAVRDVCLEKAKHFRGVFQRPPIT
jgi:putative transposase